MLKESNAILSCHPEQTNEGGTAKAAEDLMKINTSFLTYMELAMSSGN